MIVRVFEDKSLLGVAAGGAGCVGCAPRHPRARAGAHHRRDGNVSIEFLDALTGVDNIDWQRVEMFTSMNTLAADHSPASFRKYLLERLIHKTGIAQYHLLDGNGDPREVARRVGEMLKSAPVDIAFAGIGENGHLAF